MSSPTPTPLSEALHPERTPKRKNPPQPDRDSGADPTVPRFSHAFNTYPGDVTPLFAPHTLVRKPRPPATPRAAAARLFHNLNTYPEHSTPFSKKTSSLEVDPPRYAAASRPGTAGESSLPRTPATPMSPPESTPPGAALASTGTGSNVYASKRRRLASTVHELMRAELRQSLFRCMRMVPDLLSDYYTTRGIPTPHDAGMETLHALVPAVSVADGIPALVKKEAALGLGGYSCAPPNYDDVPFRQWFCAFANAIAAAYRRRWNLPSPQGSTVWSDLRHDTLHGSWNDERRPDFALLVMPTAEPLAVGPNTKNTKPKGKGKGASIGWRSVLVVGEHLSMGSTPDAGLIQLACYAEQVFIAQPFRQSVLGILTLNKAPPTLSLWRFDRAGGVGSYPLNFGSTRENLASVVECLGVLPLLPPELKGFWDPAWIDWNREKDAYPLDWDSQVRITLAGGDNGAQTTIAVQNPLCRPSTGLLTKGTGVYKGIIVAGAPGALGKTVAVKFTWRSIARTPEADMYQLASTRGVVGLPQLLHHGAFTTISGGVRGGRPVYILTDPPTGTSASDGPTASRAAAAEYISFLRARDRELTCLVFGTMGTVIRDLFNVLTPLDIARAMLGALIGHASLFFNGDILHRDISPNNIISCRTPVALPPPAAPKGGERQHAPGNHRDLFDKRQELSGCLIDLDYAVDLKHTNLSDTADRTGTYPFIAINLLLCRESHRYRHDLESLFYVLLWICIYGHAPPPPPSLSPAADTAATATTGTTLRPPPTATTSTSAPRTTTIKQWDPADPLGLWHTGQPGKVAGDKTMHIVSSESDFTNLLSLFRPGFEAFARAAQRLRFVLWQVGQSGKCFALDEQRPEVPDGAGAKVDGEEEEELVFSDDEQEEDGEGQLRLWLKPEEVRVGVHAWRGFREFKSVLEKLVKRLEREETQREQ